MHRLLIAIALSPQAIMRVSTAQMAQELRGGRRRRHVFIRSERLFLRPAWAEDRAELIQLTRDEVTAQGWISHSQPPRYPRCLITLPDRSGAPGGAQIIGTVGFAECDGRALLHLWIADEYRNQGYGTEAARAALALARTLGLHHIVASRVADSDPGCRLLAGLGFVPTGPQHLALRLGPTAADPTDPRDRGVFRRAA